jgi:caffeoyl-CoA O-methyltransferase
MNKQFGNDDPSLAAYVARVYAPEDQVLAEIRERCTREGLPDIQVASLDGRHLEVLTRAVAARRAVEIGTLGGYSGVCILRGMAEGGLLHTIEMEPHHAAVARESFERAGFPGRARVHVGMALEVLPALEPEGPFDLCFIDADKESYPQYLTWAAAHLRPGGAVVADNAFLFGHLGGGRGRAGTRDASMKAMLAFHESLAGGGAFRATVLPTGEGLAVGIKLA